MAEPPPTVTSDVGTAVAKHGKATLDHFNGRVRLDLREYGGEPVAQTGLHLAEHVGARHGRAADHQGAASADTFEHRAELRNGAAAEHDPSRPIAEVDRGGDFVRHRLRAALLLVGLKRCNHGVTGPHILHGSPAVTTVSSASGSLPERRLWIASCIQIW